MKFLKEASYVYEPDVEVMERVRAILEDVKANGDKAIKKYTKQFDKVDRDPIYVTHEEMTQCGAKITTEIKDLIIFAIKRVEEFAEAQKEGFEDFEREFLPGIRLGQKIVPVRSVGVYVPGGLYPLLSSPIMSIVPARVAGVERIAVATPPQKGQNLPHPAILWACTQAGAKEIYCMGGAQAVAGLAYGTETVNSVNMIVGPGNKYVTEAKRQMFGIVGIDLLAGPSEVLVLADETADPEVVSADLLAQAEHDPDARALLVTTSEALAREVMQQVESQLENLETKEVARTSWDKHGLVVVATNSEEAIEFSNSLAPEHLEIHVKNPRSYLNALKNYGSLFLGDKSAVVFSDKCAGTNHILPTGTAARYTEGLWVGTFLKALTYQEITQEGVSILAPRAEKQAIFEKLDGHAKSAAIRLHK